MNTDNILVKLFHLDYGPSLVPLGWMWSHLILYADAVAYNQRRKLFGVRGQSFAHLHVAVSEGDLPVLEGLRPCLVWLVFTWKDGDEILDGTSKENHCR